MLAADVVPKADRIAAPATAEQKDLISVGVALHDRKDYAGAVAKYKQVLAENPWELNALHELALTYFTDEKYEESLATARLGAQVKSPARVGFYMAMGSALDELGRGAESIEVYRAAIKQEPTMALLHYNLAISLKRAGKLAEAKSAVEKSLELNPKHPGSHLTLGQIYTAMGLRVPAIFADTRFLTLEPESPRSLAALQTLNGLITGGVTDKGAGKNITITLSLPSKKLSDEGDFASTELMLSMSLASDLMVGEALPKKQTRFQKLASLYTVMGQSVSNSKAEGGFAARYYVPYFAGIGKGGYAEGLIAIAWKSGRVEGSEGIDPAKADTFLRWSDQFVWALK